MHVPAVGFLLLAALTFHFAIRFTLALWSTLRRRCCGESSSTSLRKRSRKLVLNNDCLSDVFRFLRRADLDKWHTASRIIRDSIHLVNGRKAPLRAVHSVDFTWTYGCQTVEFIRTVSKFSSKKMIYEEKARYAVLSFSASKSGGSSRHITKAK